MEKEKQLEEIENEEPEIFLEDTDEMTDGQLADYLADSAMQEPDID